MKPYNERLPMIDAAIDYYKGKLPREANPDSTLIVGAYGSYYFISEEYFNTYSGESEFVCYEEEFKQRAKELGWINGYKWGVEYLANGEKPDLPDDLMVQQYSTIDKKWITRKVSSYSWFTHTIFKFRIVDERYRPKAVIEFTADSIKIQTPGGEYKDVIDLTNGEFNKMNNDWYENGELPPANTECEVKIEGQWLPTVVVGHYANEAVVVDPCVTVQRFFCTTVNNLRPLHTETDKLVEQMERSFEQTGCVFTNDHRALAEHLIEQGYRKIKPMSEDEFVQDALKHFVFKVSQLTLVCEALRELHSAGCRFIDKGE